ncbi:TRAP transporter small permease [Magnetovibrio sp. PR-2]|uniref:TRAP transporter small permease subunit n=1 Tax=Magnetovibrio sp. PR-2 TaxID=3120356 RepID=UPI002FCE615D
MAGTSSVLEDASWLSRVDRQLFKVESLLALLGGWTIFSLMILAVISVGGRNLFNSPLAGYVDWIEQAMPLIAFVGIAYCQRLGGHIRMDMVIGRLTGRPLWVMEFLSVFVMLLLMVLLTWGSWSHFDRSFDLAAPLWSRDSSLDIRLPLWPAKLLVPVSFGVLSLRLAVQLLGYGRAILSGTSTPIAVPLIEDAATVAANEAAAVSSAENGDR